jgi:hypothetical protein
MNWKWTGLIGAALLTASCGSAPLKFDGPAAASDIQWLGGMVAKDRHQPPLHIIYVHGIRAEGPGYSKPFRDELLKRLPKDTAIDPELGHPLPVGDRPGEATYIGEAIWPNSEAGEKAWKKSQPFVDRYTFKSQTGRTVVVDEVNWWPLAFPLKCRFLLAPEARLAGPDKAHLRLCANRPDKPIEGRDVYYPWINPETELPRLLNAKPVGGTAPYANRALKQEIMDWGLSDAVIALGPMRYYLRKAMNEAFSYANAGASNDEFVVVSESLGSFIMMDAYETSTDPNAGTVAVLDKTADLYFFANQFGLLELARITGVPDSFGFLPDKPATPSVPGLIRWSAPARAAASAGVESKALAPLPRRQIVAFSDPSDALTFYVPCLDGSTEACADPAVQVLNVYDQNATRWLGLFENPAAAHVGHSTNQKVLDQMFSTQPTKASRHP